MPFQTERSLTKWNIYIPIPCFLDDAGAQWFEFGNLALTSLEARRWDLDWIPFNISSTLFVSFLESEYKLPQCIIGLT
jgi:hypothetical protein